MQTDRRVKGQAVNPAISEGRAPAIAAVNTPRVMSFWGSGVRKPFPVQLKAPAFCEETCLHVSVVDGN